MHDPHAPTDPAADAVCNAQYKDTLVPANADTSPRAEAPPTMGSIDLSFLGPAMSADELGCLGSYRVRALIGQGGMGVVLRVYDPQLDREFAVKVMRPELTASPEQRERFLREARAAASVQHEHVVAIHHVGEHNGVPYLAMPLLQGESLEARVAREAPLSYREVMRIGREAAAGLAAAHDRGLVHRDIKPDNLWLDGREGRVRILDFGLARIVHHEAGMTRSGTILGTAHYMAPEQARGQKVDARADLFSLGCTMYRMSTGEFPFPGDNLLAVFNNLALHEPTPPHELNPGLPRGLSELIVQLMAKAPEARPASAHAVVATLDDAARMGAGRNDKTRNRFSIAILAGFAALALLLAGIVIIIKIKIEPDDKKKPDPKGRTIVEDNKKFPIPDRPIAHFPGHSFDISSNGKLIVTAEEQDSGGGKNSLRLFDMAREALLDEDIQRSLYMCRFASDGKRVFSAGRVKSLPDAAGYLDVWERDGNKLTKKKTFENFGRAVSRLDLSTDGRLLSFVAEPATVFVWEIAGFKESFKVEHKEAIHALQFSPDGKYLASGCADANAYVWDVAGLKAGEKVCSCEDHRGPVFALTWSKDGTSLYTAGKDKTVREWNPTTGRKIRNIGVASEEMHSLAVSPNGRFLLCGEGHHDGKDNTSFIRIFDLTSNQQVASIPSGRGEVPELRFSHDGKMLISGTYPERKVRVWETPSWLVDR